jgi:prolyl 4-hydroxylase
VAPTKGDGVIFYNVSPNGTLDQNSLHASAPVIQGEKWVATKWLREREFT